ncbi:MAG: DUF1554 domain-containing protein [Leptospiraceae bacterium]|nr:DUF1554 domain-containing protein [Leptospiraceae bacterium]
MKKLTLYVFLLLLLNCLQAKKIPLDLSNPSSPFSFGFFAIGDTSVTSTTTVGLGLQVSLVGSMIEGENRSFPVYLSNAPDSDVTIQISAPNGLTINPTSLTFTITNFSTPQNFTITANEDNTDIADDIYSIQISSIETGTQIYSITIRDNDRRIFVTNSAYNGILGGISGADAKCQADTNKPSSPSGAVYKAMLVNVSDTRSSSGIDWVFQSVISYRRPDGTLIFSSDTNTFAFGTLSSSWAAIAEPAWTGLLANWNTSNDDCQSWTSNLSSKFGSYGTTSGTTNVAIFQNTGGCDQLKRLICVEQ